MNKEFKGNRISKFVQNGREKSGKTIPFQKKSVVRC